MNDLGRFRRPRSVAASSSASAWTREADAVSLPQLDDADDHVRPSELGVSYAELEYDALGRQQQLIWPAEGEHKARPFQVRASGLNRSTRGIEFLVAEQEKEVRQARLDHHHAIQSLRSHARREPGAKLRYYLGLPVLWCGDTAGVWSAAITNGDLPSAAFGQALAAGLAAVCAGMVGSELKHIRMARARRRDSDSLTEDDARYAPLFTANNQGLGIVKLIACLSVTVVALLAVGIFNLRASVEGSAAGLTFGLLAAATAIASGLLVYAATDQVADLLAAMDKRVKNAEKRYLNLIESPAFETKAQSEETARSIHREHQLRSHAANKFVESLSWRVQRRNTQVFGHGFTPAEQNRVIGRRRRRAES